MRVILLSLLLTSIFFSCSPDLPDVISTKSGLYGSKEGQFLANFISKPTVQAEHFQLGQIEFDMYSFRHTLGNYNYYIVSYVDYPKEILKSWETEQLFDQSIKTMKSQFSDMKVFNKVENENSKFDHEITYTLYPIDPSDNTYIKTKLIREKERIYSIFFACTKQNPGTEKIDKFLNSFKLYKPKKSV